MVELNDESWLGMFETGVARTGPARRSPEHGRLARLRVGVAAVVLPVLVHEAQERVAVLVADVRTPTAFVSGPRHTDVLPRLHIGRGEQHERERERREDRQRTGPNETRKSRAVRAA